MDHGAALDGHRRDLVRLAIGSSYVVLDKGDMDRVIEMAEAMRAEMRS